MTSLLCEPKGDPGNTAALDQLEAHLQSRLNGRVHRLQVLIRGNGLVLQGQARTYYAKQLAQHAVMSVTALPLVANEIEVS
jgi:osmotically-inducible protein OsmY